MAFDWRRYERLAQEKGSEAAFDAAVLDVEKLEEYMSAHYTTAKLIEEISKYRGLLHRCRGLLDECPVGSLPRDFRVQVRRLIEQIQEVL